jgi:abortive infection bacteriophage resistance protein
LKEVAFVIELNNGCNFEQQRWMAKSTLRRPNMGVEGERVKTDNIHLNILFLKYFICI